MRSTRSNSKRPSRISANSIGGGGGSVSSVRSSSRSVSPQKRRKKVFSIYCHGCETTFNENNSNFKNTRQFIEEHAEKYNTCKSHLFPCGHCGENFYSNTDRRKHFKQFRICMDNARNAAEAKNYSETMVTISKSVYGKDEKVKMNDIPLSKLEPTMALELNIRRNMHLHLQKFSNSLGKKGAFDALIKTPGNFLDKVITSSLKHPPNSTCVNTTSAIDVIQQQEELLNNANGDVNIRDSELGVSNNTNNNSSIPSTLTSNIEHQGPFEDNAEAEFDVSDETSIHSTNQIAVDLTNVDEEDLESTDDDSMYGDNLRNQMNQQEYVNGVLVIDDDQENMYIEIEEDDNLNDGVILNLSGEEIEGPNESILYENHFLELKKSHLESRSKLQNDEQYEDALELVHMILSGNQSLNQWYDPIQKFKWKKQRGRVNVDYLSLNKLNKHVINRVYGEEAGEKMKPTITSLRCPSGRVMNVVTFGIDAMIYDMLQDIDLTDVDNLIFNESNEENPFQFKDTDFYEDFITSEYYIQTVKKYKEEMERLAEEEQETQEGIEVIPVPLVIYLDETVLDTYSKLSLHPVTMTLMIYNRKTRSLDMAWRTIGYIPLMSTIFGVKSMTPEAKLADFHFMLGHILRGIRDLQKVEKGFLWDFKFYKYENKTYRRRLKFPIGCVIGDGESGDAICGKFKSKAFVKYLCRECDVLLNESDNPDVKCTFHKMTDLDQLSKEELNQKSFHKIYGGNAFFGMDFGANPYGIHGATPPDPCHQLNKGVPQRLPIILEARFSTSMMKKMDNDAMYIASMFNRQSDRSLPSMHPFRNGLMDVARLNANENIVKLLIIYLILLSPQFEQSVINKSCRKPDRDTPGEKLKNKEYNEWIQVFEETLIFCSWVYHKKHPKAFFKGGKNSIAHQRIIQYMKMFTGVAMRKDGKGWQFPKYHQHCHYNRTFCIYACLRNVDTARSEGHHKKKKTIASHTQKKVRTLDQQTAIKEFWFNTYLKAMKLIGMKVKKKFEMLVYGFVDDEEGVADGDNSSNNNVDANTINTNNLTQQQGNTEDNDHDDRDEDEYDAMTQGTKILLTFDYDAEKIVPSYTSYKLKKRDVTIPSHILNSLFQKMKGYNHGEVHQRITSIECHTEWKGLVTEQNPNQLFRACPKYRNENDWYDWALMTWEGFGILPAQLLLFLDVKSMKFEDIVCHRRHNKVTAKNTLVLVHSATRDGRKGRRAAPIKVKRTGAEIRSSFQGPVTRISTFYTMEDSYQLVDVDNIQDCAFVVVDSSGIVEDNEGNHITDYLPGNAKEIIYVEPMYKWTKYFLDHDSHELIDEGKKRRDETISEDDERFPYEG